MLDIVIRDAHIADGTGRAAYNADIGIAGDRIAEIGKIAARGRREFAADGRLVTPGWVDIHSHYDGQATWDPYLSPSSWHGCTTVIMGNCGVGFAPARPEQHEMLLRLMEGVEDIPGIALAEGLKWNWEGFGDYLDALAAMPRAIDLGAQLAHAPMRVYAMGERGARHEPATADDLAAMQHIVRDALRAGALGVSTSRYLGHRSSDGELVPGTYADAREIAAILEVMAEDGQGFFQFVAGGEIDQTGFFETVNAFAGRVPMSMNLQQVDAAPLAYRSSLARLERVSAAGGRLYGLVHGRTTGVLLCLEGTLNPFSHTPAYQSLARLPLADRVAAMRRSDVREAILACGRPRGDAFPAAIWDALARSYELGDPPEYEPGPERRFDAVAATTGRSVPDVAYDALLEREGRGVIYYPTMNYSHGDLNATLEMMEHPLCRLGLADGGAHCGFICDVSLPTYLLTHWVKGRTRGRRLSLEAAVKLQTLDTAQTYGLNDRGQIRVGYRADLNLIDFDNLRLHAPQIADDLPARGKRFVQRADGYDATLCAGVVALEGGVPTGEMPGRLLRGRTRAPA